MSGNVLIPEVGPVSLVNLDLEQANNKIQILINQSYVGTQSYLSVSKASLKKISIVDIICISIGFVLRVQAGVLAIGLDSSIWLISMTFTLSMLLALGKRKVELVK